MPRVEISTDAKFDLIAIEDYLVNKWSEKIADDFYQKLIEAIEILEQGNVIFEKYENTHFRKFLLTKHNTIIYDIQKEVITIVRILQNFQDPEDNYQSLEK